MHVAAGPRYLKGWVLPRWQGLERQRLLGAAVLTVWGRGQAWNEAPSPPPCARCNPAGSQAAQVAVSALRSWTLLLSTVPAWQLDSSFVERHLAALHELLHSEDVEVRGAAGEAVALLYDTCGLNTLPESPRPPRSAPPLSRPVLSPAFEAAARVTAGGGGASASAGKPPLPRNGHATSLPRKQLDLGGAAVASLPAGISEATEAAAAAGPSSREARSEQQAAEEVGEANGHAAEPWRERERVEPGTPPASPTTVPGDVPEAEAGDVEDPGSPAAVAAQQQQRQQQQGGGSDAATPPQGLPRLRTPGASVSDGGGRGSVAPERLEDIVARMKV